VNGAKSNWHYTGARVPIQAALRGKLQVLQGSLYGECGCAQGSVEAAVVPADAFLLNQEGQALFEAQFGKLGVGLLLAQPFSESR
jgi:hypothetical protein